MAKSSFTSWQAPPQASSESFKLGWLNEQAEDGQAWLKSQRGYGDYQKAFEILSGRSDMNSVPAYRSNLSTSRLKRNIREVRGAVTNIRPIWGYSSNNAAMQEQALMMNQTTQAIYGEQFFDLAIRRVFDWAAATCTGFAHPKYSRDHAGRGKGNIVIEAYGQPSVLPTQLPSNGDIQKAYAVTLLDEMPIYMAHGLFPKFQDRLNPTASKFWYSSEIRFAAKGNIWQRMFGNFFRGGDNSMSNLYVPVRKTWILDLAINDTSEPIFLGDWDVMDGTPVPQNSWSYMVPPLGKRMENGKLANENDARLYPNRRLVISSEACVMYDGPAFDWHGEVPLIPLCLDSWAFDPGGYSLVRDGFALQQAIDELERGIMDKNRAQMDMSLAYDINAVTSREAQQYDPMQPRGRVGFDGSLVTEPFKSVVPDVVLRVTAENWQGIEHLENTMDYQMGIKDVAALARARGLAGSEDFDEKLAAANGPIIMEQTRDVEWFITGIGNQMKYLIPQYLSTRTIMQYVGPDRITKHTYDYDPEKLIPSHMPGEKTHNEDQTPAASIYPMYQRARWFCENLRFMIAPHTAHELVQMSHKLGLLQLRKGGIQISSQTIAQAWNVANFGGPEANTEYDRYYAEQEDAAKHAIRIQQFIEALKQQGVEATPALQAALALVMNQNSNEGRPATGLKAPQMVQKADQTNGGTRTTVSQTGK